jgi:hypothetical protein
MCDEDIESERRSGQHRKAIQIKSVSVRNKYVLLSILFSSFANPNLISEHRVLPLLLPSPVHGQLGTRQRWLTVPAGPRVSSRVSILASNGCTRVAFRAKQANEKHALLIHTNKAK